MIRNVADEMGVEVAFFAWEGNEAEMLWMLDDGLSGLIESPTELYQKGHVLHGFLTKSRAGIFNLAVCFRGRR